MWREFKAFLLKQNVLALAIAVVVGAALNDVVNGIVEFLIMPIVGVATPGGTWREAVLPVGPIRFGIGPLAAAILKFLIVGWVAWQFTKVFIKPEPEKPPTKTCPFCRMIDLDLSGTRCPHCTSELTEAAVPPAGAVASAPAPS